MHKAELKLAAARYIDAHADEQIAFLSELVQCPSDNPPGDCAPHAEVTAALLEAMAFKVERHAVPADVAQRHGMRSVVNLIVRERFGDGPTVALNAHGDVVPPGGGWSVDPYAATIRDGWMIGRGAAVSKSDFASYAFALRALKAIAAPLHGSIELHLSYDEETGGLAGPQWLLDEKLTRPDYAICAGFSHHVTTAHNGCLHLQLTLRGKSAHAARPDTGHDAIEAGARLLTALYAYRDTLSAVSSAVAGIGSPTLVVGTIGGGINTNVVADTLIMRVDRRIIPEEDPDAVEADLRRIAMQAVEGMTGIQCEAEVILLARPFKPVGDAARLARVVCREASAALGEPVTETGVPLYTDARLYAEFGVPTIMYGAGPRTLLEANGHRADERLPLAMLTVASKAIAWSMIELLTASGDVEVDQDR